MNNITLFEVARMLLERNDYVILIHERPDPDTVGSAEALRLMLRMLGKRVSVLSPDPLPRYLGFLVGEPYLTEPPMRANYICVDVAESSLLGGLRGLLEGKILLKLDHHYSGKDYALYNYTDPTAAAAGEVIAELAELMELSSPSISRALYCAIASDTGCFRFGNTTARTLRLAADFYDDGIDVRELNVALFESRPPKTAKAVALGIENTTFYLDSRVAVCFISKELRDREKFTDANLYEIPATLRELDGVELSVLLKQESEDPTAFDLSVRSKRFFDCAALCEAFDGGGHLGAAGGGYHAGSPEEALKTLLDKIEELWNE